MNSYQQIIAIEIKNLRESPDKAPVGDERIADYALMRMIDRECSDRVEAARENGRHGWWDDKVCSIANLKAGLAKAITKGDMIDVINFAAMIHAREAVDGKDPMQLRVDGFIDELGDIFPSEEPQSPLSWANTFNVKREQASTPNNDKGPTLRNTYDLLMNDAEDVIEALKVDALTLLSDGWLEGRGIAPTGANLDWLTSEVAINFPEELAYPSVAPIEDGNVSFEWIQPHARVELEVNFAEKQLELYATNLSTAAFVEQTFTHEQWGAAFEKIRGLLKS